MKKQTILVGAFILALAGFISKAIGAVYKIPLANILGSNGMGVYYLIFPLYSMLIVLISSGVSIAVSKLVSNERACNNKKNEITIFKVAVSFVFVLSIFFAVALMLTCGAISQWQGNVNARLGYFAIAPAVVFASLISVVRAYFQGLENMIPTSLSNVIEQIVKLIFGLLLAKYSIVFGAEFAVLGALLGVTISELVALLIIIANFLFYKKKNNYHQSCEVTSKTLTKKEVFAMLFKYSLPATLSSIIIPITAFTDSFMVINLLVTSGQSTAVATSLYGIINGIVNTLISLPVIFTLPLSTAIVPSLSGLNAKNNAREVGFKSSFFIKISWLFSLLCFVLLLIFSADIIEILYSRGLTDKVINEFEFATKLLMVSSISVVYYAFLHTFTSILQSINKPAVPFYALAVAFVVRTVLLIVLIKLPQVNIFALPIANITFLTIATLINLQYIRTHICIKFNFLRLAIIPIFSVTISGVIAYGIKVLASQNLPVLVYVIISALTAFLIYGSLLFVLKVFTKKELSMLPKINRLTKKRNKRV